MRFLSQAIGLLMVVLMLLSLHMASAWRFSYLTIAEKDMYGNYKVTSPIVGTSNATISSDLQKIVEEECGVDKAVVFLIGYDRLPNVIYEEPPVHVVALYDPNGDAYKGGVTVYFKVKNGMVHAPAMPCPDKSRPGYWKVVFDDGSEIKFYVSSKENKENEDSSISAICGPASIIGLAILPLGILGVRKRRNH